MPTTTSVPAATRTYVIDKAHSEAVFQVRHLLTKVRGRFSDFEGVIDFNEADPQRSSVQFTIHAASVDTAEIERDKHLRTADFFDVGRHPTITFHSTRITRRDDDAFDVVGDFTMHGVTRQITLPIWHLGKANDAQGMERLGFEGQTTINRKDYGLNWNAALETGGFLVGDEVTVMLQVQAIAQ